MRNYVIINGVNSLTIQGLAINNLPPITKPMIRTQREEIDGRDGDIVTELGYSAYDKQIEIGLWGTYDINDIIKYFTGEGTIVFSNEEDKYYNFKILDQIDYQKLLKFKTATVTLHCQPFKYPVEEEPVEAEITTLTGTGETLTLNNTEEAPMSLVYKGNTHQDSTTGKNKLNVGSFYSITTQDTKTINIPAGTYTLSCTNLTTNTETNACLIQLTGDTTQQVYMYYNDKKVTFTTTETKTGIKMYSGTTYANSEGKTTSFTNLMLESGSTATDYEPYTNGASPNPDYPQPVHVVSGDNEVEVVGKNLFNVNNIENIAIGSQNQLTIVMSSPTYRGYSLNVEGLSSITISRKNTTDFNRFRFGFTDTEPIPNITPIYNENWTNMHISADTLTSKTLTIPSQAKYLIMYFSNDNETITGSSEIQVEKGSSATSYEPYTGTTYPINLPEGTELCKIGTYQDRFIRNSGKNLFSGYTKGIKIDPSNGSQSSDSTRASSDFIPLDITVNNEFIISGMPDNLYNFVGAYNSNKQFLGRTSAGSSTYRNLTSTSFTGGTAQGTGDIAYIRVSIYENPQVTGTIDDIDKSFIMLNEGTSVLPYEPYGTGWYVKKEIGKVVLDGSENWNTSGKTYYINISAKRKLTSSSSNGLISNYFKDTTATSSANVGLGEMFEFFNASVPNNNVGFNYDDAVGGTSTFKTWLSSNNVEVRYVLATPTYTLIEDSTLIEELESMKKSKEGQTNISQTNNDLPFELDVSVTFLTPMEINNIGNIYAKPILTIEGTGNIGVVLNDIQILDIDLTNNGKIAIDVPKLEAYNPDDDTLLNRLVTGDYMKLLINEGENTITFTGNVSGATLTNYIRWI